MNSKHDEDSGREVAITVDACLSSAAKLTYPELIIMFSGLQTYLSFDPHHSLAAVNISQRMIRVKRRAIL